MTSQSQEDAKAATRIDRPSKTMVRDADVCEGCRELTARVEQLEQALAIQQAANDPQTLSTTACYWICVGVHALAALLMYSSDELVQYGMMLSIGSMATLVVCQVLSTRPVHLRVLRSLLSICIVAAAAMLGMWFADMTEPSDVFPFLIIMFPPVFVSGWIIAKPFLWFAGWRIVPPGYSTQYARLQIRHLLFGTLMIAAYLAIGRSSSSVIEGWLGDELAITVAYLIIPTMVCTLVSCLLARTMLAAPAPMVAAYCLALAIGSVVVMTLAFAVVLTLISDMSINREALVGLSMYAVLLSVAVFASSSGTFAMMRIAKYRFYSNRLARESSAANPAAGAVS